MLPKVLIEDAPTKPGVYFFENRYGKILYIGKAKSLRARLRSYTHNKQTRKVKRLLRNTVKVDYAVCGSELEALLLESQLIKQHKPKYNVFLKHIRPRPFIKISLGEPFPRVLIDYEIHDDGAKYFGPFPSLEVAQESVDITHKLFPLRTCERPVRPKPNARPCLEYQIGRCSAPCAANINKADYRAICDDVVRLVSGQHPELLGELTQMRDKATAELRFEQAARIQHKIECIGRMQLNAIHNNNLAVLCPSIEAGFVSHEFVLNKGIHPFKTEKGIHPLETETAVELFFIKGSKLYAQHRISPSAQKTLADTIGSLIAEEFSHPASSKDITPLDLDAMNIISRWLYANQREYRVLALPDLPNQADALAQMTCEVVRAIRAMTSHVNN